MSKLYKAEKLPDAGYQQGTGHKPTVGPELSFEIASGNIRSANNSNLVILRRTLLNLRATPKVILLQECWGAEGLRGEATASWIKKYHVLVLDDAESQYRGVATLISKQLSYKIHSLQRNLHLIEVVDGSTSVYIVNCYSPPKEPGIAKVAGEMAV